MGKRANQLYRQKVQKFLLSFFSEAKRYEEKEVNEFWLVKRWHPEKDKCDVAIYNRENFENYKEYQEGFLK